MTGTRRTALSTTSIFAALLLAAGPSWAQAPATSAQGGGDGDQTVEEVVVTGSSIRGVPPTGSNLIGVSRQDIETVGATTTPDLLAAVPQLNNFNTAPKAANGGFGSFAPGLRALPASATLVLMNGHRLVGAGANETNPDYPQLPALALERVEIVADGASSIYGSDAIAGVVNFITRKRYTGAEASVRYGVADDYHTLTASGLVGKDWGTGSILASYQYTENGNVTGGDRDYRQLDFRPYGGVDTRSFNCPTPNLVVGGVTYAGPNYAPGTLNYCDNGAVADLYPKSRIHSFFLTARQEVSEHVTVWGDLLYSDRKDVIRTAVAGQTVTLTAANPYFVAPPGTGALAATVLYRPDNLYGDDHVESTDRTKVGNSSAGFDIKLPGDFNLTTYGTFDWATNDAFIPQINPTALAVAAAGTTPGTALDPFGNRTSPATTAAITNYSTAVIVKQRTYVGAAKIDGPLATLPGGQLKVAAGAEYRRETFQQRGFVGFSPVPENLDRNIYSVYGEVFVPIVGDGNAGPLLHRLDLSLSGRYDHYSDFGSTTNPKVGVNWDPIEGLTIRGTYGRSFRAPGVRQVGATVGSYFLDAATAGVAARDPTRGAAQVNTVILLGGNHDLQPEKARTYSLGADWRPTFAPGFHASVTYYNIRFTNVIGAPPTALIFTDPTFSSVVYRNPSAATLSSLLAIATPVTLPTPLPAIGNLLDQRLGNFGVRKTNGLDFDIGYRWTTDFGAVYAGLAGNQILKFDTQLSPSAPVSKSLRLGTPRTTVRASLGANAGAFNVAAFVNYRDGIINTYATPTGLKEYHAKAYTTVDLRASWTMPDSGWTKGTELALQVNDLFDKTPPFFPATSGIGGDYNPIGRLVAVNLRKTF